MIKNVIYMSTTYKVDFESGDIEGSTRRWDDRAGRDKIITRKVKPHSKKWYEIRAIAKGIAR